MRRFLGMVVVLLAAACGGDGPTAPPPDTIRVLTTEIHPAVATAVIEVEAIQVDCCYDEGSSDVLEVVDRSGWRIGGLVFGGPKTALGGDMFVSDFPEVRTAPGVHTVSVWQEDCGMTCGLDEDGVPMIIAAAADGYRSDLCSLTVDVPAGGILIEVRWSVFSGCLSIEVVDGT